jgi:hypothetical protein
MIVEQQKKPVDKYYYSEKEWVRLWKIASRA